MPLHRLQEEPNQRAALVDITCDSDGKIIQFACHRKTGGALPLHPLRNGEPYYLGFFLMGAYQATMGDIHNLFGRVNEVHVFEDADEPGGYYLEEVVQGQTVKDVLTSVQYLDAELIKMMKDQIDALVKAGTVKPREGVELLDQIRGGHGPLHLHRPQRHAGRGGAPLVAPRRTSRLRPAAPAPVKPA